MSKQSSIPEKDADFNIAQNIIATTANTHVMPWGLDGAWMEDILMPKKAEWEAAWAAYEIPSARTPLITFTKTEKREAYERELRVLVKNLQANTRVTPEDLRAMGIVVPSSSRTPAPVATKAPDFDVDTSVPGRLAIHFYDKVGDHKRGKPDGQHCVEIISLLSDTPPTRWDQLVHSVVDTRSPYTFVFENDQRGKTLYFAMRWENTRGEKGPWSEIQGAIIP
ncbi:MAG: hypothetical protein LBP56_08690 [Odoribacteraceae bacterium]|jgi:hypothetical protein|nr:hypothetical protein [Odoribacteraceae bacterium]